MSTPAASALLPLRGFYLFTFVAMGSFFPFLPLLLAQRNLDPAEISWVMATIPVAGLLVPPLWGLAADALRARLPLLRLASVASAVAAWLIWPTLGLWGSMFAIGVFAFFRAPITTLADAATYDAMGGRRVDFSKVRLWGSVGFVLGVYLIGALGGSHRPDLLVMVPSAAYLLSVLTTLPLRTPPVQRAAGILRETRQVVTRPALLLFLLANGFYYCGHASYDVFFSLHVRALGYDDTFVGTAWALAVGVEILLMLLAPRFIHRLPSGALLALCAGAAVVRWGLNAILVEPPALLFAQALHGVTFGIWYLAMVKHVQAQAPDHLRTSLQSVAIAAMGFGMVSGYLVWGAVMQHYDGHTLFAGAATSAAVALLFYGASLGFSRAASEPRAPLVKSSARPATEAKQISAGQKLASEGLGSNPHR